MKTKIIYISGNEVFEMAQIRAAFEEVRNALGLDKDTILFGVPVDQDNALTNTMTETMTDIHDTVVTIETNNECDESIKDVPEIDIQEEIEYVEPEIIPEVATIKDIIPEEVSKETHEQEQITTPRVQEKVPAPVEEEPESDPVIPILSILSTNDDGATPESITETETLDTEEQPAIITDPIPETQPEAGETENLVISIDDIIADEAPVATHEKTLEELLESMTPLGEDIVTEPEQVIETQTITDEDTDFSVSMTDDATDTDATLAQLANEFAQTQDTLPEPPKPSGNGKIGKLKNILPFKKAKRDDSGLMGDLFGWAGIAANDEDFSIPGFFTGAVGQK